MREQEVRELYEAYQQVHQPQEEVEQLNEISLKTKMKAYAASRDVDADYNYGSKVHDQGDRIKKAIVKKHGPEAGEHAERHAEVSNFGRGTPRPKPRIEKNRTYRTTKAGKMHGQDQEKLKSDLKKRRYNESYDLFDVILEHLVSEGYADTNEAALAIMANMSEEWRQSIVNEAYDPKGQDKLVKKMSSLAKPDPDSTQAQNQKRKNRSNKMYDKHYTSYVRPKSMPGGFGGPEWKSRKNKEKNGR